MNFAFLLLHATEVYILGLQQGDDCIAFFLPLCDECLYDKCKKKKVQFSSFHFLSTQCVIWQFHFGFFYKCFL